MEELFLILLKILRVVVIEAILFPVFYWVGWVTCKLISFGQYPYPQGIDDVEKNKATFVYVVGVITSILNLTVRYTYLGSRLLY